MQGPPHAEQYQKGTFFLVTKGELTNYGITPTTDVTLVCSRGVWDELGMCMKAQHSRKVMQFVFISFNIFLIYLEQTRRVRVEYYGG